MKNSLIHICLPNANLRDFLSLSLVKLFEEECNNKKEILELSNSPIDWTIKDCENEIAYHQRRLKLLKEKQAIITLIKMNGWEEFDVSDWTVKDLNNQHKLAMSFIGTQEEYDNLIVEIRNESK